MIYPVIFEFKNGDKFYGCVSTREKLIPEDLNKVDISIADTSLEDLDLADHSINDIMTILENYMETTTPLQ